MSTTFEIELFPLDKEDRSEVYVFDNVDLGFNQFGWVIFTNPSREPVSAFPPGTIRCIRQSEGSLNDPSALSADEVVN